MLESLIQTDRQVFLFFNGLNSPLFDVVMTGISGNLIWIPLYFFFIYSLWKRYQIKTLYFLLVVALVVTLSDQLSVQLFKNTVQRLRPCHDPALTGLVHLVNGYCGGQYGFVSSHAANTFAVATFLSLVFKGNLLPYLLLTWALIVSFSRIYLGVHFPGDVLCGAILGSIIGGSIYACLQIKKIKQLLYP